MPVIKRISYPDCDIEGHQFEPLSRICTDKKCEKKSVICCICEQLDHKSHTTTPLKSFIQKFGQGEGCDEPVNLAFYGNKIDEARSSFLNMIAQQKSDIIQKFQDLRVHGEIYFNKIQQMALGIANLSTPTKFLDQNSDNPKAFKSYFSKVLKIVDTENNQSFSIKKQLQLIGQTCEDKKKKLSLSLVNIRNQVEKNINKILGSLDDSLVFKSANFEWSKELKGHKVKITDAIVEQTGMQSSGQRFALIEPSVSEFGKKKQLWGIKIKKFVGWVGIGICLKNSIKKANYHFNYTNVGHGSYLISSNGYSWSHSVKQLNSAFKTFQFTVNDIVYMEYDPDAGKLRFRKNQGPEKFELDITPPPVGDAYHPCVNLCSTGDSVELIQPGIALS